MSDDDVWDRVVDFAIGFGGALALGALFFLDFLILDVHWKKAMLISWMVIACTAASLGVWTMRKIAVGVTVYALGYLVGALPALERIGAFLTRALR
jgi:hypothetical protein